MTAERSNQPISGPVLGLASPEAGLDVVSVASPSSRQPGRARCLGLPRRLAAHPAGRRESSMVTSRIPIPLAILGVLLSAGTAGAQKAKYTRQQDIKIDAKLSERSRPITPKDPKDQSQADQPLTADQVLAVEGLVGAIRAEQEQILIDLITKTPDTEVEEKSDYYFRLGELYAKQQRYWRLEGTRMLIQSDQTKNPQQKAKLKADADTDAGKAKEYLIRAVKTYKSLTDNEAFRNYPKMDMALFYYGFTLQ